MKIKLEMPGGIKTFFKKFGLILIALLVVVAVLTKLADYAANRYECHSAWVESNIDYKYTVRGGCLLKRNDVWIPAKNFRID